MNSELTSLDKYTAYAKRCQYYKKPDYLYLNHIVRLDEIEHILERLPEF
jgi:hypothetical protein